MLRTCYKRAAGNNHRTPPHCASRTEKFPCTARTSWLPCIPCACAIIIAGIKELITHKQIVERTSERWEEELQDGVHLMDEAGVRIIAYDGVIGVKNLMEHEEWDA
ncbi:hypothetical protein GF367_00250 [Candidatus Woesearchaeota archaeon]|nr:hypothetical protein [Candidatus Woesearchaeota archaeon]